ncbi:MAG: hypothetical protein ACI845_002842 [Gammaproteobacteria bacterium]
MIGVTAALISNGVYAEEYFSIKNGELERPTGFREWIYFGTPVTPNDMNNGKAAFPEHHNIYIDPRSSAHWKKTAEFREGTILMKELVSVGSNAAVSGSRHFQGDFIGLEATIKSKKYFPNEPGNWAYYSFSNPDLKTLKKSAKAFPAASCAGCHAGAAEDERVFTQYYPVFRGGKGKGTSATRGMNSVLSMDN